MFELPKIKYSYDALEPFLDAKTVEIHYTKHHQNYLTNFNSVISGLEEFSDKSIEDILKNSDQLPESIRQPVINNGGGYYNHNLYWEFLSPGSSRKPTGNLKKDIESEFGSFDIFKERFSKSGASFFGSGWMWLTILNGKLLIEGTANQDNPISKGRFPILGLDLWEHAYYLKYQNLRAEYISNWWGFIDWETVERKYTDFRTPRR